MSRNKMVPKGGDLTVRLPRVSRVTPEGEAVYDPTTLVQNKTTLERLKRILGRIPI